MANSLFYEGLLSLEAIHDFDPQSIHLRSDGGIDERMSVSGPQDRHWEVEKGVQRLDLSEICQLGRSSYIGKRGEQVILNQWTEQNIGA